MDYRYLNDILNALGCPPARVFSPSALPRAGGLYVFGCSQDLSSNGSRDSTICDLATDRLLPQFRWAEAIASTNGRALALSNFAVGGSGFGTILGSTSVPQTHSVFNQMGQLPYNWQGLVIAGNPWNDTGGPITADTVGANRRAAFATALRASITDWVAVGVAGWSRTSIGAGATPNYTTNGSNLAVAVPAPTAGGIPFPCPTITGLYINVLSSGNFVEFDLNDATAWGACPFFLDNPGSSTPCEFTIKVDGVLRYSGNAKSTYYDVNKQFPFGVLLGNIPAGATIRIDVTTGTVFFLGCGSIPSWRENPGYLGYDRTILISSVSGNTAGNRSINTLQSFAKHARAAAGTASILGNVRFVDFASVYREGDADPRDPSHFGLRGDAHFVEAVEGSEAVPFCSMPECVIIP